MKPQTIFFRLLCAAVLCVPVAVALAANETSDAEILAVAGQANRNEVEAGQLALTQASSPEVKKFAEMMVKDHTKVLKQAADLGEKLKLAPEDTEASKQLKQEGDTTGDKLRTLSGAEFDKAYIDAQVADHRKVLSDLDSKLIPGAQNPQVKALLQSVRPKVAMHLKHAEALQKKLDRQK